MDFNKLPEKILEKILLMCPNNDIPDLTLVSKRFNQVIGNSVELMRNFKVFWKPRRDQPKHPLIVSTRNYRFLYVTTDDDKVLRQVFIKNNAQTLTLINLSSFAMTSTELKNLLNLVACNIRRLSFHKITMNVDCAIESIELPKLNHLEVKLPDCVGNGFGFVIRMFKGANLKQFSYKDADELSPQTVNDFADLLSTQKNLLDLWLSQNVSCELFERDQHDDWYQDTKLIIVFFNLGELTPIAKQNFEQFVFHQKGSLKILSLVRIGFTTDLLITVLQTNLEELRLVRPTFEDKQSINIFNTSINSLFLSSFASDEVTDAMICNIMKACCALKEIYISNATVTFEMSITMAQYVDLQTLDIWKTKMMPITYPTLKNLKFRGCDFTEIIRLIKCNWNLEEISAPRLYSLFQIFRHVVIETMAESVVYS